MKKIYTTLIALVAIVQFSYAQWSFSGTNIYNNNAGNVGIGTTTPPTIGGYGVVAINGKAPSQGAYLSLMTNGTERGAIVVNSQLGIQAASGIVTQFFTGSSPTMQISGSGNVGIGTTTPTALLNVQGGGTTTSIANIGTTLTARFNTANPPIALGIGYVSSDNPFIQAFNGTTNSTRSLIMNPFGGNIGVGTITPDAPLTVNGTIHSKEVKVDMSILPDYVFLPDYNLLSLEDVKSYIDKNHHLPEVPSTQEVAKEGLNLGEMNAILLKKVEELTLYLIEKGEQLADQQAENKQQNSRIEILEKTLQNPMKDN